MGQRRRVSQQTQKIPFQKKNFLLNFDFINGEHPWRQICPEGFIDYKARKLEGCKVVYFNFALAMDMGLAPPGTTEMSQALEKKLLDQFALQIINEYDLQRPFDLKSSEVAGPFMATRYLQLQHLSRTGKTSGDGRSIWNGIFNGPKKIWDVSSRGTGTTAFAPGVVEAGRPLKTGSTAYGYACGTADLQELISGLLMSEVFHRKGIPTERTLLILQTKKQGAIGVRAAPCLLRPSHLFLLSRQNKFSELLRAVDFVMDRGRANGDWKFGSNHTEKYDLFLEAMTEKTAKYATLLERQYIFKWLDWDGDNCLLPVGIVDYGSIRQFGTFHDEYRYDDDTRWSTSLKEQREKFRLMVQNYAQIVHYLKTGKKNPLRSFDQHPSLQNFDEIFEADRSRLIVEQVGLSPSNTLWLLRTQKKLVQKFIKSFLTIESVKTGHRIRLPDGMTRKPLFSMRKILSELPGHLTLNEKQFIQTYKIKYSRNLTRGQFRKIVAHVKEFLRLYKMIFSSSDADLGKVTTTAQTKNQLNRLTGDAVETVAEEILKVFKKSSSSSRLQTLCDAFIGYQSSSEPVIFQEDQTIFDRLRSICVEYSEGI